MKVAQEIPSRKDNFSEASFKDIEMHDQALSNKQFHDCLFEQCDFSNTDFDNCVFADCEFLHCNLSLIKIPNTKFRSVKFTSCKIIGVNWTSASWPNIQVFCPIEFDACILNDSTFYGLYLVETKMEACQIHGVDFSEANCEETSFIQSDLFNSRFNQTNLVRADFTDAVGYSIDVFNNQISKAKFSLPEATSLLDSLDIEVIE